MTARHLDILRRIGVNGPLADEVLARVKSGNISFGLHSAYLLLTKQYTLSELLSLAESGIAYYKMTQGDKLETDPLILECLSHWNSYQRMRCLHDDYEYQGSLQEEISKGESYGNSVKDAREELRVLEEHMQTYHHQVVDSSSEAKTDNHV